MSAQALLVVHSEEEFLEPCREALARAGFTTYSAPSAAAAVALCGKNGEFDLLVADILADDEESRRELLERVRDLCPCIKVLFLSTSTLEEILAADVLPPEEFHPHKTVFLRHPQPASVLAGKILGLFEATAARPVESAVVAAGASSFRTAAVA